MPLRSGSFVVRVSVGGRVVARGLPVLLAGATLLSGCRTDPSSSQLQTFGPPKWFGRSDVPPDADDDLQPIPDHGPAAPPLPAEPPQTGYRPAPAPAPVPDRQVDGEDFYDIRPTAAVSPASAEPSWSERFRDVFEGNGRSSPTAKATGRGSKRWGGKTAASSSTAKTRKPVERGGVKPIRQKAPEAVAGNGVVLGIPEFDAPPESPRAIEPISRIEPVTTLAPEPLRPASAEPRLLPTIRSAPRPETLPTIRPRGAMSRGPDPRATHEVDPASWPHGSERSVNSGMPPSLPPAENRSSTPKAEVRTNEATAVLHVSPSAVAVDESGPSLLR